MTDVLLQIGQEVMASKGGASTKKAVIKLNNSVGGIREIKVVPYEMVAKTVKDSSKSSSSSAAAAEGKVTKRT